jgi:hypothetical protein
MIKALVIPSWLGRRTNFEKDKYINPGTQSKLTPSSLKKTKKKPVNVTLNYKQIINISHNYY